MKKLFVLIFMTILLVGTISAQLDFDNIKGDLIINDTTSSYGIIEIRDWFGLLKLATLELKENTDVCGEFCSAEKEIIMFQNGVLIQDIKFETILEDETRIEQDIRNYKFSIQVGEEDYTVNDYDLVCKVVGKKEKGGRWSIHYALKKDCEHSHSIKDYYSLCRVCHGKYDFTEKKRLHLIKIAKLQKGSKSKKKSEIALTKLRGKNGQFIKETT